MFKRSKESQKAESKPKKAGSGPPETALQFVLYLIRGTIRGIPKRIALMIVTAALVLGLHTYLMVYVNDGFWRNEGTAVLQYILMYKDEAYSLTQKMQIMTPAVFWYLVSVIFWGSVGQVRSVGLLTFFKKLGLWFGQLVSTLFGKSNRSHSATLTLWVFCSFAVAIPFANPIVTLTVAVMLFLAGCAQETGILYTFFKLARADWARFRKRTADEAFSGAHSLALLSGAAIGALLYFGVRQYSAVSFLPYIVLALLLATHLLNLKGASKGAAAAVFLLGLFIVGRIHLSYADDGGWSEAGSNLWDWLRSEGAGTAFIQSSWASFMSILGVLAIDAGNLASGIRVRLGNAVDGVVDVTNRAFSSLDNAIGTGTSLVATWYANRNVVADRTIDQIRAANHRSSLWARTQKHVNFTKYGTWVQKLDKWGKVGGFIVPIGVDTYGNYVKGAEATEYVADTAVNVGVTVSSIYVGAQIGAAFGTVAGPPGALVGALVGLGTSIVYAYVIDGIVIDKDPRGENVTIKSWMQDTVKSGLDYSVDLVDGK